VQVWGNEVWIFAIGVSDAGLALLDRLDDAGAPDELLWPTPDELAFDVSHEQLPDGGCDETPCGGRWATWPGATVFNPDDGGSALIFYQMVSAAPGDFNFSTVGEGLAVWTDFASLPTRPSPNVCPNQPTVLFCADEPGYGEGAAFVDGGVYTFACQQSFLTYACQLARVPFDQALDKTAWQFWDGSEWASSFANSKALFNAGPILSFFWNGYLGQWMVVYSAPLSNDVSYRTAPALTGPWSGEGRLFEANQGDAGGTTYDAYIHPELSEQGGKVQYVTYSRGNGTAFGSEFALVRVTFE
jgi:hypothetical protein